MVEPLSISNTLIENNENLFHNPFNINNILSKKNLTVSYIRNENYANTFISKESKEIIENLSGKKFSTEQLSNQFFSKENINSIKFAINKKVKTQPLLRPNPIIKKEIKSKDMILDVCKNLLSYDIHNLQSQSQSLKLNKNENSIGFLQNEESLVVKEDAFLLEQNPTTREHMEDYLSIKKNFMNDRSKYLYILCDGHSGDQVAKIVVDRLPEIFSESLIRNKFEVEKSIIESFAKMDEELIEFIEVGSTCCLLYICEENGERVVYSGNVGDSRSILVRAKETIRLSFDHKANEKSEIKRVKQDGGLIIRGRLYGSLAITRALGDFTFKIDVKGLSNIPYISRTVILDTDQYLICGSDGVWDVITEDKANTLINESLNLMIKDTKSIYLY